MEEEKEEVNDFLMEGAQQEKAVPLTINGGCVIFKTRIKRISTRR
jgi:hypothetical protein